MREQLTYILKNVLLAVTAEAKMGSEIEIDVSHPRRPGDHVSP